MGIRNLNRMLNDYAPEAIQLISLSNLRGKKIAVDASIYMYKYVATDSLSRDMNSMLSIFRQYQIDPIFVFDGKPTIDKRQTLEERKRARENAKLAYVKLEQELISTPSKHRHEQLTRSMAVLRRTMITIQKEDIALTKRLLTENQISYIESVNESDEVCAKLCGENEVYACLSEDMDMFAYGCSRVLRYFSLTKKTAVIYDLSYILSLLGISLHEFRQICVLSGTDYYPGSAKSSVVSSNEGIRKILSLSKQFRKLYPTANPCKFYDWLMIHPDEIVKIERNIQQYDILNKPIAYIKVTPKGEKINVASTILHATQTPCLHI